MHISRMSIIRPLLIEPARLTMTELEIPAGSYRLGQPGLRGRTNYEEPRQAKRAQELREDASPPPDGDEGCSESMTASARGSIEAGAAATGVLDKARPGRR